MQLIIKNLSKTYPNGTKALDGVNLNIDKGMFGLLGPNGAGKSTLMRTISTLQEPDTGSAQIGDINILESPMELRKILGYLPQSFGVYPKMTANKLLHYFAALKGIASKKDRETMVDYVLDITNLTKVKTSITISNWIKLRLGDTFRFVIHHNLRHVVQAKNLLE